MKKQICIILTACMIFALASCGRTGSEAPVLSTETNSESSASTSEPGSEAPASTSGAGSEALASTPAESGSKEWTRQGTFEDADGNHLIVSLSDTEGYEGWAISLMLGDETIGWVIQQDGNALRGNLNAWDEQLEPFNVTITEEGEDGLKLEVEGGETYIFTPMEVPEASIVVTVNTEGMGSIAYAEGEKAPEIDPEFPSQSAYIGLAEPAVHSFTAEPDPGNLFVKWTKNGEDFSTEPRITLLLDESAEYIAVFEEDPDSAAFSEAEGSDPGASLANPWTDVATSEDAAAGSGVGYFTLPGDGTEMEGGVVGWDHYRYMDLLAEADGYVGAAELTVRKGVSRPDHDVSYDTADVSGDYTDYAHEWTVDAGDWQVRCFGNEKDRTMKAVWSSDNFSYCILVRGQGDIRDTYGLSSEDIAALVNAID